MIANVSFPFLYLGHVSRKGDEDFFTSELFGLWEGLGVKWVEEERKRRGTTSQSQRCLTRSDASEVGRGPQQDLGGPLSVARLLAALRGEPFECAPE